MLTSQSGIHFGFGSCPLVKEAKDGTPWINAHEDLKQRVEERPGSPSANPFESRSGTIILGGRHFEARAAAMAKAWLFGAALNLAAPAIITSPIFSLAAHRIFCDPRRTLVEKMLNFLFRSDNALYAWV